MRQVEIIVGGVTLVAELYKTPTADRIWRLLPIFATVQTRPGIVYFETDVESGLEPDAVFMVQPGDIVFTPDQDTITVAYGPTAISRPGEIRLTRPANVWARTSDDVGALSQVHPGQQATIRQVKQATAR